MDAVDNEGVIIAVGLRSVVLDSALLMIVLVKQQVLQLPMA